MLRVVAPSEQARMATNPKNACDADSCTDLKTGVPAFNKTSGSAMRRPSARHAECQRRMTTTITSYQGSEQRIHESPARGSNVELGGRNGRPMSNDLPLTNPGVQP